MTVSLIANYFSYIIIYENILQKNSSSLKILISMKIYIYVKYITLCNFVIDEKSFLKVRPFQYSFYFSIFFHISNNILSGNFFIINTKF